jgi:nucleoside-diphosphate-sugar epimerase|tara:strand:- start:146 stop:970 length:825 start_codon:yes stop_codon:yes gene_type:complete
MKKKILIIGKNSFVGNNLYNKLKNLFDIKIVNYKSFFKISDYKLSLTDIIINCSISKNYIHKKYFVGNDRDFQISKKIKNFKCKMIFLSSRKVYLSGDNLRENSKLYPKCCYSKNKLKTEKKLTLNLKKRVLILRISNLIGIDNSKFKKKKIHKTFADIFFQHIKKNIIFDNNNDYKDFLSITKFCEIVKKLIKNNANGIYNVSVGKKIYLNDLIEWLNIFNKNKYTIYKKPKKVITDSFFLNNYKLMKKININNGIPQLKNDCKMISKLYFSV